MLIAGRPALILAPMEGVTDAAMRALQGETGAFSFAVSEFLRVSQVVLPRHVIARHVPELRNGCRTPTGTPVQVQLLGGDPGLMAESAAVVCAMGANAIDLNFGCPARTVNRHDGGATLLKYPARIRAIVSAVRSAVPKHIPVSAKMRLGWDSTEPIDENAAMAAEGGASWLTIHGRTRVAGYAPPIYWQPIGRVRESLGIPVVANGDIWTIENFRRCRDETGCHHYMLGRGALADPRLPYRVAGELGLNTPDPECDVDWPALLHRLLEWTQRTRDCTSARNVHKLKQWLFLAAKQGRFTQFDQLKRAATVEEFFSLLDPQTEQPGCAHRNPIVGAA